MPAIRSTKSSGVQSATEIGGNTATSTVPGFIVVELRDAITCALRMTTGTIGIRADIAMRNGPFLKGPTSVVSSRVPSGAMTTEIPLRARSSTLCNSSTADLASSRSMNTASISLPSVPTRGSDSSSFFPTPVKFSRTSADVITGSKLLRWLKRKTAGRCAVRFSRPSTLTFTPLTASSSGPQLLEKKLIPRRRFLVSRPHPTAPTATGSIEPAPASARAAEVRPVPLRLVNLVIGHPR